MVQSTIWGSERGDAEVLNVTSREVNKEAVKRSAIRSTKESAKLERRTVPAGFERSEKVKQFLDERRQRV